MVSGLVTSPCDQLRIFSGEARLIRMASKSAIELPRSNGLERYKVASSSPAADLAPGRSCSRRCAVGGGSRKSTQRSQSALSTQISLIFDPLARERTQRGAVL